MSRTLFRPLSRRPTTTAALITISLLTTTSLATVTCGDSASKPDSGDTAADTGAGETGDTTGNPGDTAADSYHPGDWSNPVQHGMAAKMQDLQCTSCHGSELDGGSANQGCDDCHEENWRTDCVFCHGGVETNSGAPPVDIDNLSTDLSFPEHRAHGLSDTHPDWDCDQCHRWPGSILSPGHLFLEDSTAGRAEVDMKAGLSPGGVYKGAGSCSNLYCHGNGAGRAGDAAMGETYGCGDCHGDSARPQMLSGQHASHMEEGIGCTGCHGDTVSSNDQIANADMHVNGDVDVAMSGISWDGSTCSGTCHGQGHSNAPW